MPIRSNYLEKIELKINFRSPWLWALIAVLLGTLLAVGHALTKLPHVDEGDIASAAISLIDQGRIAFPISYQYVESARYEYLLIPPFYPASLAAWFAAVGHSIEAWRLFHVIWFVGLVAAWIRLMHMATRTAVAVPLAAALLALNYDLINLSVSRYDIVCAALNASAMAAYTQLRKSRFGLAVLSSNVFLACSATTHPFAVFGLIGTVAIAMACGDLRRLRPRHALLIFLPYAVGFGSWALIIDGRWETLLVQVQAVKDDRIVDITNPFQVFMQDIVIRWWRLFAGWREDVPIIIRAKTVLLLLWAIVPFFVFRFATKIDEAAKGVRTGLIIYTVGAFLIIPFVDPLHLQIYNIHVIAGFVTLTAIVLADLWTRRHGFRPFLLAAVVAMSAFGVMGIGLRIMARDLQRKYSPVIAAIRAETSEHDLIIGPSELAFGLGFHGRIRDDPRLSSLDPEKAPRFIVETRERGFNRTPSTINWQAEEPARKHTLRYIDISPSTPRNQYRILRLENDCGEAIIEGR